MTFKSTPTILGLLLLVSCADEPKMASNSFVYENFLGEGRPHFESTSNRLDIRNAPYSDAQVVATEELTDRDLPSFDGAITRTLKPGQIDVHENIATRVRSFGEINTLPTELYYSESIGWVDTQFTPEDKPAMLMWTSEGHCLIKIANKVYESGECSTESGRQWKLISQPVTETWIELKINNSKGWVKVDGQQVREISRNF
jgi:hypothetical protein